MSNTDREQSMHQRSLCLEVADLIRFLEDELPGGEESSVIEHLDVCEPCRQRLETMAAPQEQWRQVAECLRDAKPGPEVPPLRPMEPDEAVARGEAFDAIRDILGYLAPTDDPQMLGRLGPYEIVGVIGRGGMGVVLKGYDRPLNRFVAIKVLSPLRATSGAARQRFAREARAAAAVVHQHVIAIHQVDEFRGLPYLVMPYLSGPSLQRRIERDGSLSVLEVLRIGRQVALGLAAAHEQGLVHRDVKPANILLESDVERVTITDFGLARAIDDVSITQPGIIAGTPQYMSPEQSRGEAVDARSDLFSLGSVLYAMCTGSAPFRGDGTVPMLRKISDEEPRPMRELNPDVPPWLEAIVQKLHRKKPEERFQSASELAALLEEYLFHLQQPALYPAPRRLPPTESAGSSRRSALVGAAVLALLIGSTLWWGISPPTHEGPSPNDPATLADQSADEPQQQPQEEQPAAATASSPAAAPQDGRLRFKRQPLSIPATPEKVRMVSLSHDGRFLAVAHGDQVSPAFAGTGSIYVWDLAQRQVAASFLETHSVIGVALSQDGSYLAYGTLEGVVKAVELASGREVLQSKAGPAVAFSPNGKWLAAASYPGEIHLWNTENWARQEVTFAGNPRNLLSVCFSPDSTKLAAGGGTFPPQTLVGEASVWDVETGERVIAATKSAAIMEIQFTPDGRHLVTACLDTNADFWELSSGDRVHTFRDPESGLNRVSVFPNGNIVATLGPGSGIKLFDRAARQPHARLRIDGVATHALAISPDGRQIISGGADRLVRLWDAQTYEPIAVLQPGNDDQTPLSPILSVAAAPDGSIVAMGREDGSIVLRDAASGKYLRSLAGHEDQVTCLVFLPDARTLISGGYDNTIRFWDLQTGEAVRSLSGHSNWVMALALSPDASQLASGSYDRTVRVWDIKSGALAGEWLAHEASVRAVAFSADGTKLLSAGSDSVAKIWEIKTQKLLVACDGHKRPIRAAAFAPDGQTAATASEDGRILLWNARTGLDRRTLNGHNGMVWSLAFTTDGKTLVSGGDDMAIHVWDVPSQRQLQALPGHGESVTSLALVPDSGKLVSVSLDQSVKFWTPEQAAPSQASGERDAEQAAIDALKKLGGDVTSSSVSFRNAEIGDADLVHLKAITGVTKISLIGCRNVTDVGLSHMKGMKELTTLYLPSTGVGDSGLEHLKEMPKLTNLYLSETKVGDSGLEHLKRINSLRVLYADCHNITDAGLKHLSGLSGLVDLSLKRTKVTDAGLQDIARLTKLAYLHLNDTAITDAALEHLKKLTSLVRLDLTRTQVTDAGVGQFKQAVPKCEVVRAETDR
jgi:WD40 repeat protein